MLPSTNIIYRYEWSKTPEPTLDPMSFPIATPFKRGTLHGVVQSVPIAVTRGTSFHPNVGLWLLAFAFGGLMGPMLTRGALEAKFLSLKGQNTSVSKHETALKKLPPSVPLLYQPLALPDGSAIEPVNRDFSLVIPKIGVNAPINGSVDPKNTKAYTDVLKTGIAHASTSVYPGQNGSVFLFSHSTNYEWFVRDLNAIFYLLKNLETGESVVVFYQGKQYNYKISGKKVVKANDATYLYPLLGREQLILQTCWPPGSTAERLLIFADIVEGQSTSI